MGVTPEQFLNAMLEEAMRDRASDVHIEPLANAIRVRFRVDGYLQERIQRPLTELDPLVTRIKAISNLNLTSRLPQDGHFELRVTLPSRMERVSSTLHASPSRLADALTSLFGKEDGYVIPDNTASQETQKIPAPPLPQQEESHMLNVRVSVFPTVYGEAVVLRILNRDEMLIPLSNLGMEKEDLEAVHNLITRSYGMILTTGPSNAGKTTTLYAIIQELKDKAKNIITLEDPVEFYFGDIRQTQIRAEQGLTYAVGMRSILRQDPDVLIVGEIRDAETAEYAMRASLVGRLVGSSIHSNTAIGTIARLIDMQVERSLLAFALNGIIAQRLVRKTCQSCLVEYTPDAVLLSRLQMGGAEQRFVKGKGCPACGGTGFAGRVGIYSVLVFTDELRSLIVERASMKALQDYVEKSGAVTLRERAIQRVMSGVTTVEEAAMAV